MNTLCIGLAVTCGLLALIPSKEEQEWAVPWASIGLAAAAGLFVALAGVSQWP